MEDVPAAAAPAKGKGKGKAAAAPAKAPAAKGTKRKTKAEPEPDADEEEEEEEQPKKKGKASTKKGASAAVAPAPAAAAASSKSLVFKVDKIAANMVPSSTVVHEEYDVILNQVRHACTRRNLPSVRFPLFLCAFSHFLSFPFVPLSVLIRPTSVLTITSST